MAAPTTTDSCVSLMQGALVRPVARYPASVVTDASLKVAPNRVQATLVSSVGSGDTLWTFADTSRLVPDMLLSVDSEIVSVTSINGNVATVVRGFDGTIATCHSPGRVSSANIVAWHHNALVAEVEAIEQALGPNLSNVAGGAGGALTMASRYIWARSPGGALTGGSVNTVTLSPVPLGVNGTDKGHWLYVSGGTGAAEPVLIVGGTAVAGAASGTVLFTPVNNHTGSWSIGTATSGAQEALQAAYYTPGVSGIVYYGPGLAHNYGPVVLNRSNAGISGSGIHMSEITMHTPNTDIIQVGDGVTVMAGFAVSDMTLSVSVSAPNTSGYGMNIRAGSLTRVDNIRIYGANLLWRGIHISESNYADIFHCLIEGIADRGIQIEGTAARPNTGVKIFETIMTGTGSDAIFVGDYANAHYIYDGEIYGVHNGYSINLSGANTYAHFIRGMDISCAPADGGLNAGGIRVNAAEAEITDCQIMSGEITRPCVMIEDGTVRLIGCEIKQNSDRAAVENYRQAHIVGTIFNGSVIATRAIKAWSTSVLTSITGCFFYQYNSPPIELDSSARGVNITGNSAQLPSTAGWVGTPVSMVACGNSGVDNVFTPIASAATITVDFHSTFIITGTTAILTINGGWEGRKIHLYKPNAGDVVIGGGGNVPGAHTLLANIGHLDLVYTQGFWG